MKPHFVRSLPEQEKWEDITFDTVLLDHYWLPDSVVWLNKGYMVSKSAAWYYSRPVVFGSPPLVCISIL